MRAPAAWVEAEKHVPGVRQCPEMVVVPAFTMGSPPGATSLINEPVAVGKLDVPVDQFAAFVRELGMREGFYLGIQILPRDPDCPPSWLAPDRRGCVDGSSSDRTRRMRPVIWKISLPIGGVMSAFC
jgi:hypothetical protein